MPAYDARPDGEPIGGVVVVQEAFGVNDHIEDVTRRFADAGYRAIAPHLFHRSGDATIPYDELEKVMQHMAALVAEDILADIDASVAYLGDSGLESARVGIVGFCMGGSVTAYVAERRRLGAAVSFYGGGVSQGRFGMPPLVQLAPGFQTPWLGLYGGEDQGIPVEDAEALRAAAGRSPVPTDLVLYADAGHGFHCDQRPESYNAAAAADGWERTLSWFAEHLAQNSIGGA
jgi:carboxymethylenebutenolidase